VSGLTRAEQWIERRGADSGLKNASKRAELGDEIVARYGVARTWKRITAEFYVVAICLIVLPIGSALHLTGALIETLGMCPLIYWLDSRSKFRKAMRLASAQRAHVPS
jgi:hypothetical protein